MGLTLAFKKKYGNESAKITQAFVEQMVTRMGNNFKEKGGITGSGIKEVAPHKLKTNVDGNKFTATREAPATCPAIVVAKQMNLPLEMVCNP